MKGFQGSTFDEFSRRRLIEDRDTIHELTGKIQELQNDINYMNDSRDFQDAESVRTGHSHVASQPVFPTSSSSWRNAKPFYRNAEPQKWAAKHLEHTWYIGKRCCKSSSVFSAPYPQELNPWSSHISEQIHSSQARKSENQTPVQDKRCQSGLSARNSVVPSEGGFSKNYGADQQLQISDPHCDTISTSATFACWKIRFKTEVCTCSQFSMEAMLWIKEVELVDSVDDL